MTFRVVVDPEANADLQRLYQYLLDRCEYIEDLEVADRALQAIDEATAALAKVPFLCRREARSRTPLRRELVVPFEAPGYVLKYEIASPTLVVVLAVRHQHEADYH